MSTVPELPPLETPARPPTDAPAEPKVDPGVGQVYLLFAICICLLVTVGYAAQIWSRPVGLAITEVLIFLPAVVFVRTKRLPVATALGWRPISLATALLSVVLGVSGIGIAAALQHLSIPFIGPPPEADYPGFTTLWGFVFELLCSAVLPGICEETFFRGAIQGTLSRLGPHKSVLITAFLFALFHLSRWNFLAPLFFGVVLGILTFRSGSTIPAMIVHVSWNATACAIGNLIDHSDPAGFLVIGVLSVVFVVVFSVYSAMTRHHAAPLGPLAFVPAGLSRRSLAAAVAGTIALVGLSFFVSDHWLGWHLVTASEEALGLHEGDQVLLLKGPLAQINLGAGDIVEFEPDGRSALGKAEHCDPTHVWLVGRSVKAPLNRREITGRAIQVWNRP